MSALTPTTPDSIGDGYQVVSPNPAGSGTGNVIGASSSTDNAIVRWDGVTGKVIQSSGVTIDDNNNVVYPVATAGTTQGMIYKGASLFIHNYKGNYASLIGKSLFIGVGTGNTTANGTANTFEASANIGVGDGTLAGITTGYANVAVGSSYVGTPPLSLVTTGAGNFAMGTDSMTKMVSNSNNLAVGTRAMQFGTGSQNSMVGAESGMGVNGTSTYGFTTALGFQALKNLTTGNFNIAIGYTANTLSTTGGRNIMIGNAVAPSGNSASSELNIDGVLFGKIGNASVKGIAVGIQITTAISWLEIAGGTTTQSQIRLNSGTLKTTPVAGEIEFVTDDLYVTISTGASRKKAVLDDGTNLVSGRIPFATTNGRLKDDADLTFATDTLTATKIVGSTSVKAGSAGGYISSDGSTGATGTFTTVDLKTVTVKDGIITSIV